MNRRKIKLRAWNRLTKTMHAVQGIDIETNDMTIIVGEGHELLKFTDAEIMESTGIIDKNDVEIFEGDIVRHSQEKRLYRVFWHGSSAGFELDNEEENPKRWLYFANKTFGRFEVVGNVFENPDLISKKKIIFNI